MKIEDIFAKGENGALTLEQFTKFAEEGKAKFTDLAEGKYEDVNKRSNELESQKAQIKSLEAELNKRNEDLTALKTQLEAAGADTTKLTNLQGEFDKLKAQYAENAEKHKAEIDKLNYEFAVKERANGLKFSSTAAKRDFTTAFIEAGLKMDGGSILGADDFIKKYSAENEDAFIKEADNQQKSEPKPTFAGSTTQNNTPPDTKNSMFNFNFTGVRKHD